MSVVVGPDLPVVVHREKYVLAEGAHRAQSINRWRSVEAPMCQECVSGRRCCGGACVMVTEESVVDLACDKPLETADDVLLAQALRCASRDVIHRGLVPA